MADYFTAENDIKLKEEYEGAMTEQERKNITKVRIMQVSFQEAFGSHAIGMLGEAINIEKTNIETQLEPYKNKITALKSSPTAIDLSDIENIIQELETMKEKAGYGESKQLVHNVIFEAKLLNFDKNKKEIESSTDIVLILQKYTEAEVNLLTQGNTSKEKSQVLFSLAQEKILSLFAEATKNSTLSVTLKPLSFEDRIKILQIIWKEKSPSKEELNTVMTVLMNFIKHESTNINQNLRSNPHTIDTLNTTKTSIESISQHYEDCYEFILKNAGTVKEEKLKQMEELFMKKLEELQTTEEENMDENIDNILEEPTGENKLFSITSNIETLSSPSGKEETRVKELGLILNERKRRYQESEDQNITDIIKPVHLEQFRKISLSIHIPHIKKQLKKNHQSMQIQTIEDFLRNSYNINKLKLSTDSSKNEMEEYNNAIKKLISAFIEGQYDLSLRTSHIPIKIGKKTLSIPFDQIPPVYTNENEVDEDTMSCSEMAHMLLTNIITKAFANTVTNDEDLQKIMSSFEMTDIIVRLETSLALHLNDTDSFDFSLYLPNITPLTINLEDEDIQKIQEAGEPMACISTEKSMRRTEGLFTRKVIATIENNISEKINATTTLDALGNDDLLGYITTQTKILNEDFSISHSGTFQKSISLIYTKMQTILQGISVNEFEPNAITKNIITIQKIMESSLGNTDEIPNYIKIIFNTKIVTFGKKAMDNYIVDMPIENYLHGNMTSLLQKGVSTMQEYFEKHEKVFQYLDSISFVEKNSLNLIDIDQNKGVIKDIIEKLYADFRKCHIAMLRPFIIRSKDKYRFALESTVKTKAENARMIKIFIEDNGLGFVRGNYDTYIAPYLNYFKEDTNLITTYPKFRSTVDSQLNQFLEEIRLFNRNTVPNLPDGDPAIFEPPASKPVVPPETDRPVPHETAEPPTAPEE